MQRILIFKWFCERGYNIIYKTSTLQYVGNGYIIYLWVFNILTLISILYDDDKGVDNFWNVKWYLLVHGDKPRQLKYLNSWCW